MNQLHANNRQHWLLLGTAPASEEVWGVRRIAFPCGYHVPASSFAKPGQPVCRPNQNGGYWGMGGFAIEIAEEGKNVADKHAVNLVAGYRPWLALFRNTLIDELTERHHSITVWDRGVSIFYGLWQEGSQILGERITVESQQHLSQYPLCLQAGESNCIGTPASQYAHQAADVISFMSQFMTLSPGDIYVLGPLAAQWIDTEIGRLAMHVDSLNFETAVQ